MISFWQPRMAETTRYVDMQAAYRLLFPVYFQMVSAPNARTVMRQVRILVSGTGVDYTHWSAKEGDVHIFAKGRPGSNNQQLFHFKMTLTFVLK